MASAVSNQFSAMSQEDHRIEDDISDEEILEAIKNSMKDQQVWNIFNLCHNYSAANFCFNKGIWMI